MMFLNIITPCSRPENLYKISESINIPRSQYRWFVVFDKKNVLENTPYNAECYAHQDAKSTSGNAQRNYALDKVISGHIYFNDDDTLIHPDLWENIKDLNNDFISFKQVTKDGKLRLQGNNISLGNIDSHNFIIHSNLLGNTRWVLNRYDADGLFAYECKQKSKSFMHLDKTLSVYNALRK
jgi:hypothetical protein